MKPGYKIHPAIRSKLLGPEVDLITGFHCILKANINVQLNTIYINKSECPFSVRVATTFLFVDRFQQMIPFWNQVDPGYVLKEFGSGTPSHWGPP